MKNYPSLLAVLLLLLSFTCEAQGITGYGPALEGCRLAKDSANKFYVINEHGAIISPLSDLNLETDQIIDEIKTSGLMDAPLIVAVIKMHSDPAEKMKEVLFTTLKFDPIALLVLKHAHAKLLTRFTKKQLKKLMKKKKC